MDVQYVSSTSEHAIVYFDSKNITWIGNRSEDPSLDKSDDANNISHGSDLYLLNIYIAHCRKMKTLLILWVLIPSTAGLINTSGNIIFVGKTQTSIGSTVDDSVETTIEPRSINSRLKD